MTDSQICELGGIIIRDSWQERAYAEVLTKLCEQPDTIALLDDCWKDSTDAPYTNATTLAQYSTWMLNFEGWWYLLFRTNQAEGAKLIIIFFRQWWLKKEKDPPTDPRTFDDYTQAEKDALLLSYGTAGNPATPEEAIRKEFVRFMRTQTDWIEQGYGSVAAGDIGPWPKTGGDTGGD